MMPLIAANLGLEKGHRDDCEEKSAKALCYLAVIVKKFLCMQINLP